MVKAAILVLCAPDESGRMTNALQAAKEFADAGDELEVILDGAATQWVAVLEDEDHVLHGLYDAVTGDVGVCDFCVGAYDADEAVDEAGLARLDDYYGHPSVRELVADGYEVVTF